MTAYVTPVTAVAGYPLSAAEWNSTIRDSMESVAKPERVKVRRSTALNIAHNLDTVIPWDSEDYDSDNMWAIGTPSRFVAPFPGTYQATMNISLAWNATGARVYSIRKNGVAEANVAMAGSVGGWHPVGQVSCTVFLATGEYLEGSIYQNSGVTLGILLGEQRWMEVRRVSK